MSFARGCGLRPEACGNQIEVGEGWRADRKLVVQARDVLPANSPGLPDQVEQRIPASPSSLLEQVINPLTHQGSLRPPELASQFLQLPILLLCQ